MSPRIEKLTAKLKQSAGAPEDEIRSLQENLHIRLPSEYVDFLQHSNGGEGFVGPNSYLMLWPVEKIPRLNAASAVNEFASGLVLFGTNGGDTAYAFDTRDSALPIVDVPLVGMGFDYCVRRGATFSEFLDYLEKR